MASKWKLSEWGFHDVAVNAAMRARRQGKPKKDQAWAAYLALCKHRGVRPVDRPVESKSDAVSPEGGTPNVETVATTAPASDSVVTPAQTEQVDEVEVNPDWNDQDETAARQYVQSQVESQDRQPPMQQHYLRSDDENNALYRRWSLARVRQDARDQDFARLEDFEVEDILCMDGRRMDFATWLKVRFPNG